jgi:nucleotide-binding universal stress UspA family protein
MIRSILAVLDDTPGAEKARDAAIAFARRTGASLTAAVVLDDPHAASAAQAVPPGAGAFLERRNAALAKRLAEEADAALAACREAAGELAFETLILHDAPAEALIQASARHDIVVVGRDSSLGMEEAARGVAPSIEQLLLRGAKPMLIVPPEAERNEGPVLIGYDGSVPAMRALHAFALLRPVEAEVIVVSVGEDRAAGEALAADAVALLHKHRFTARAVGLSGSRPIDLILAEAVTLAPRLLVMGAFEEGGLRTWLFGSGTRKLLREATCPLFAFH